MSFKKLGMISLFFLVACDVHINKNFDIADNTTVDNDLITVNGSIFIGENCIVNGTLSTVNGSINISRFTTVDASMQTVNGAVDIERDCKIDGNISALTGSIEISDGCAVTGNVSNVSGEIYLNNVVVSGDVTTNFGNITIAKKSDIKGTVIIEENDEIPEKLRSVRISISDSTQLQGGIVNKNNEVHVTVFVEPGSIVNGEIVDVKIIENKSDFDYE